jgi:glucose/arabinose dehydrogenase
VAPTGIAFYDGNAFPEDYKNNLFITLHGSWNRTKKVGYKVISVSFDNEGNYLSHADFISGWLQGQKVTGRPSAVFVKSDGSLLISDDKANVVYRVTYSPDLI